MKYIPILLLFQSGLLFSQNYIEGKVTNAESGEAVPFVNIGVKELGQGTVSDVKGHFKLKISSTSYSVIFSSIGYQTQWISVEKLERSPSVQLVPKTEILEEVVVMAAGYGENIILGNKLDDKGHSIGFGSRQLGTEIGAHVKIKKETYLKNANFTLNFIEGDSILFRVNIYDFNKGKVGEKLVKEDIIITAPQAKETFTINLEKYNIIVDSDILLALEWIQDDGVHGNAGIMFRSKKSLGSNLYTKITSHADFKKLSETVEMAPKLQIGFYLEAVQIND